MVISAWSLIEFERPSSSEIEYFNFKPKNIQIAFTLFLYPLLYQPNIQ